MTSTRLRLDLPAMDVPAAAPSLPPSGLGAATRCWICRCRFLAGEDGVVICADQPAHWDCARDLHDPASGDHA